jgi:hypothetical protein
MMLKIFKVLKILWSLDQLASYLLVSNSERGWTTKPLLLVNKTPINQVSKGFLELLKFLTLPKTFENS